MSANYSQVAFEVVVEETSAVLLAEASPLRCLSEAVEVAVVHHRAEEVSICKLIHNTQSLFTLLIFAQ